MNPYVILGIVVALGMSHAGVFWLGTSYEEGQQAKTEVAIKDAVAAVKEENQNFTDTLALKIADGFRGIRLVNTTINNEVRHEHEIQTRVLDNPDCNVPRSTWLLLNAARGYGADGSGTSGPADSVREASPPAIPAPGR